MIKCLVTKNGALLPVSGDHRLTPLDVVNSVGNALNTLYDGTNEKHFGKTKLQAATDELASKAQDGDGEALEKLLDRAIGKSVQQVNSLSLTADLKDFLDGLNAAADEDIDPIG